MNAMKWLLKTLFTTILVSTLTVMTTWAAVSLYIDRLLDRFDVSGSEKVALTDVLVHMLNGGEASDSEVEEEETEPAEEQQPSNSEKASAEDDALPVMGRVDSAQQESDIVMSTEEFNQKREQLSEQDKQEVFKIMMSKVPQQSIQRMSFLLEDGLDQQEMSEVMEIMKEYLTEEELEKLVEILNK